jgi:hypothetical protein
MSLFLAGPTLIASILGCSPPPRMCTSGGDCGELSACVAGRCVAHGATPAISTARRLLFDPVEVGYVSRTGGPGAPTIAPLGKGDGALALLRFSVPLPVEATVLEAYVVLERVSYVDRDPLPIALHVARVTAPWDERSLSWASQPRVEEIGSPVTRVLPAAGPTVRLDVRDLIARWRRRSRDELGVAIVAEGLSPTGMAFALAPSPRGDAGPRLELYVR